MTSARYNVLLIEDSPAEQGLFRELIARKNLPYDLMVSSSVAEAKDTLASAETKFDVVLADYRLNDGTAFDVIGQIEDTPIIFITGWGNLEIAVKAIRAGAADFIEKDSDGRYFETIPRAIERVISVKRTKDQYKMLHELHETVLANSFDAFTIIDLEGNILFANDSLVNLSRYLKEELAGLNLSSLTIGNTRFVAMVIRSCQKGEKLINLETTLLPKTGPAVPVALSACQVKNHEKILICMRDLRVESDLSEEVKLFRKFSVNLIHAGLFVWGAEGPDPVLSESLPFAQKKDELLMKMAIYYFTALGQGQGHNTGLFGPLPLPDVPGYVGLAYTFFIDDPSNIDPRSAGRSYCFVAFSMPETLAPIFSNRSWLAKRLQKRLEDLTTLSELTLAFLVSLKFELLGLDQEVPVLVRILNEKGLTLYSRKFRVEDHSDQSVNGLVTIISRLSQDSKLSLFNSLNQIKHKEHVIFFKAVKPLIFFYICKSRSYDEQRKLEEFIKGVQGNPAIYEALAENNQAASATVKDSIEEIVDGLFLPSR